MHVNKYKAKLLGLQWSNWSVNFTKILKVKSDLPLMIKWEPFIWPFLRRYMVCWIHIHRCYKVISLFAVSTFWFDAHIHEMNGRVSSHCIDLLHQIYSQLVPGQRSICNPIEVVVLYKMVSHFIFDLFSYSF